MKKKIILVCGRTASGKSSIVHRVCADTGLKVVSSSTTRPKRPSEVNGTDHIFIKPEEVDQYRNDFAAYTEIDGYEYFATKGQIEQSDFYVIDPNGVEYFMNVCSEEFDPVVVYVRAPRRVRIMRSQYRGDTDKNIQKRMAAENEQFTRFEKEAAWDYHILNDSTMDNAIEQLKKIAHKEMML